MSAASGPILAIDTSGDTASVASYNERVLARDRVADRPQAFGPTAPRNRSCLLAGARIDKRSTLRYRRRRRARVVLRAPRGRFDRHGDGARARHRK